MLSLAWPCVDQWYQYPCCQPCTYQVDGAYWYPKGGEDEAHQGYQVADEG